MDGNIEKVIFAKRLKVDLDTIQTMAELDKAIYDKLFHKIDNLETDITYLFNKLIEKGVIFGPSKQSRHSRSLTSIKSE